MKIPIFMDQNKLGSETSLSIIYNPYELIVVTRMKTTHISNHRPRPVWHTIAIMTQPPAKKRVLKIQPLNVDKHGVNGVQNAYS